MVIKSASYSFTNKLLIILFDFDSLSITLNFIFTLLPLLLLSDSLVMFFLAQCTSFPISTCLGIYLSIYLVVVVPTPLFLIFFRLNLFLICLLLLISFHFNSNLSFFSLSLSFLSLSLYSLSLSLLSLSLSLSALWHSKVWYLILLQLLMSMQLLIFLPLFLP